MLLDSRAQELRAQARAARCARAQLDGGSDDAAPPAPPRPPPPAGSDRSGAEHPARARASNARRERIGAGGRSPAPAPASLPSLAATPSLTVGLPSADAAAKRMVSRYSNPDRFWPSGWCRAGIGTVGTWLRLF
jgi:hypothetical protein